MCGNALRFRGGLRWRDAVGDFTGGVELGNDIDEGPNNLLGGEVAPADNVIVNGLAGGNDSGNQAFGIGKNGAVVAKRLEVEVDEEFSGDLLDTKTEEI